LLYKELKNVNKTYFANMRIAEKFDSGKSADIWQHVRLDGLFQNLKKVTWDFSYILEISCIK